VAAADDIGTPGGPARVAGLLLAAGAGRRFGTIKALADFRGRPLVEYGIDLLVGAGCAPVVVVVGAAAGEVARRVQDGGRADVVVNGDWATGMASSLRAGFNALEGREAAAVVVALVDQPLVAEQCVRRLVTAWQGGAMVAVATYEGRPRNPVLFDRSVWRRVAAQVTGDSGARDWLADHADLVAPVGCDGSGTPFDIDTAEDLAVLEG
jgi:nicotine blue oxidoreductase